MTDTTAEDRWDAYMKAFGRITPEERERLLEESVSDDVVFTNPGGEGKTRAGLAAHIETFHRKMPSVRFDTDKVFQHHDELLAIWSMYKDDGTRIATGYNFVHTDPDGRFNYMAGFF